MPEYLYRNPNTGKVISVIQRMSEDHVYEKDGVKYERVFTSPNAAIDTNFDCRNAKDFASKTSNKKETLGDIMDRSRELHEKRKDSDGVDPVRAEFLKKERVRRKGKPHPSEINKNPFLAI